MAKIDYLKIAWKKGEPPFNPIIRLWLSEYSKDKEEHILLSPDLMTDSEIDYNVDRLIAQLNVVRRKAKKALLKAKQEVRGRSN